MSSSRKSVLKKEHFIVVALTFSVCPDARSPLAVLRWPPGTHFELLLGCTAVLQLA